MTILEPLIIKSMQVKKYTLSEATERAEKWLAGELGVTDLSNLDYIQQWTAEAYIERAMLPPPKKRKHKIDIPQNVQQYLSAGPLSAEWLASLKAEWPEDFYRAFFGELGVSKGLLSPGQKAQQEWSNQELILA